DSRHASRSVPLHTASISRNLTNSGMTQANNRPIKIVSAILNRVENSFSRSQPSTPVIAPGGGRGAILAPRTNAISLTARSPSAMVMRAPSPFRQRHSAVVNVHQQRVRETDDEIDKHRDCHDLHRLAGLIEHSASENLHQIGVAYRH